MAVGRHDFRLDLVTLEIEAIGVTAQANGFQFTELALQAFQLAVVTQLEVEYLADLEAAELLGFLAAVERLVQVVRVQPDLGKDRGQRIAVADGDAVLVGIGRSGVGCCWILFISAISDAVFGAICARSDLGERRGSARGWLSRSEVVLFLQHQLGVAAEVQIEKGLLRFDFTRRKHQQSQAQQRSYTTRSQDMALGVGRGFRDILRHGVRRFLGMCINCIKYNQNRLGATLEMPCLRPPGQPWAKLVISLRSCMVGSLSISSGCGFCHEVGRRAAGADQARCGRGSG